MSSAATDVAQPAESAQSAKARPSSEPASSEPVSTAAAAGAVAGAGPSGPSGLNPGSREQATDYSGFPLVAAKHPWRWVGTGGVGGTAWTGG